jgi:hypothetical protein
MMLPEPSGLVVMRRKRLLLTPRGYGKVPGYDAGSSGKGVQRPAQGAPGAAVRSGFAQVTEGVPATWRYDGAYTDPRLIEPILAALLAIADLISAATPTLI